MSFLSLAVLLIGVTAAQAATFTVNTTADNATGSAECAGVANDCGLRQAIDKANKLAGDDTVVLPTGHYTLTIAGINEDLNQTGDLDIENNGSLTLTGAGARSTTIDGGGIDRVIQVLTGATATISGVTITGGSAPGEGGGIDNGGTLTLTDSTVTGNHTVTGQGGVGGGIANPGTGLLTLTRDTISSNQSAVHGGGVDIDAGSASITDTTLTGNTSVDDGGGLDIDTGGTVQFTNDTIYANTAGGDGGGVWIPGSHVSFANTIVAKNLKSGGVSGDCFQEGALTDQGHNLDSDGSCFTPSTTNGDITTNPLLGPLQNNGGPTDTMALLDGSPAINAAANAVCPATDQRGITRPQPAGGVCDIGAYEATAPLAVTNAATGTSTTRATLDGTVNPTNLATTYHFEYGKTTAYGTSSASLSAGLDYATHAESAILIGLTPNTTYHFRIVATNAVGTTVGADQVFTTGANAPVVVTGGASGVGSSAATVHGSVNPNGAATMYHFDYGTTTRYGKSTTPRNGGSGTTAVAVGLHLTGLRPGAVYHYRLVGQNAGRTTSGGDRTFSTKALIAVAGVSGTRGCTRASSANVQVRVTSLLRPGITVTLDGKRIAGGKGGSLKLRVALANLRRGTHRLTFTVKSAAGTTTRTVAFNVCAARIVTPVFTG